MTLQEQFDDALKGLRACAGIAANTTLMPVSEAVRARGLAALAYGLEAVALGLLLGHGDVEVAINDLSRSVGEVAGSIDDMKTGGAS